MTWVTVAVTVAGAAYGAYSKKDAKTVGQENPSSKTTESSGGSSSQDFLDPRMESIIYGSGGIVPNVSDWYSKNSSGLNDKMVTGMNNQWNQLGSSKQGFDQMQSLGMGLMGGGSAGNPFTGNGGVAAQDISYKPAEFSSGSISPFTVPVNTPMPAYGGGGGGGFAQSGQAPSEVKQTNTSSEPQKVWIDDVEGGHWGLAGSSVSSGYKPTPYVTYQFNNGYPAYGAEGSSAENPQGTGGSY